jgi:hypothetical protein
VTVSLYMPVSVSLDAAESNEKALDAAFDHVQQWVDRKVNSVLEELEAQDE